ncbi:MAG: hypothetical protein COC08_07375 [Maribacter sp.]|nr:MAG: hypothetical protein COC08_07375 [Maribacter sp.]
MRLGVEEVFLGTILTLVLTLITLWVLLLCTVIVNKVAKESLSHLEKKVTIGLAEILNAQHKQKSEDYNWVRSYCINNEKFLLFASVLIRILHLLNSNKPEAVCAFAMNNGITTIIDKNWPVRTGMIK